MPVNREPGYRIRLVDGLLDELLGQLSGLLVVGARATGKTTTISRRARTIVRLDRQAEAAAFAADPDAALRGLAEPILIDEWQNVPGVLGAVKRAVDEDPRANRFLVTGSVRAELDQGVWPGTGRLARVAMYPLTIREQLGRIRGGTVIDKIAGGEELTLPRDPPDLRGYIALALRGGFPPPALQLGGRAAETWLESYLTDLFTHDIEQLEQPTTRRRDPQRLTRFFESYALNSAGVTDLRTIYDAAQINRATAVAYERLLTDLLVIEQVPAWTTNRLKRLVRLPKRYVIDPALVGTALRLDENGVLRDGDLLGRMLDTLVAAQLRPEVSVSSNRPRLHHLRTEQGRHEIDLVVELAGDRLIGLEIKATSAPTREDARHLRWLRDELGERFAAGVVFHTGPRVFRLEDRIVAAPIAVLWG